MSKRKVGRYLAVFVCALLTARQRQENKRTASNHYANEPGNKEDRPNATRVYITNEDWPPDDSRHQRNESKYWVASVCVSIAAFVAAGLAAYFAGGAYYAAKDQAQTARDAFIQNDRPIVDISFVESDVLGKTSAYKPRIIVAINNIGNKPGYVRDIVASVKAGGLIIGRCDNVMGQWMVQASAGLSAPCLTSTLTINQVEGINDLPKFLSVYGIVNYKSLTGQCWLKAFKFIWSQQNEFTPAHFFPDPSEKTNDERPVSCSAIYGLDD